MTRKTADICGDCWHHLWPGEYEPDGGFYGICTNCDQPSLVHRTPAADVAEALTTCSCCGTDAYLVRDPAFNWVCTFCEGDRCPRCR